MKHYIRSAIAYALLAMAGGVFYREYTKYLAFDGKTTLAFVHTHYFMLGMVFFLLLLLLEKSFTFTRAVTRRLVAAYHVGLNLTAAMLFVRGVAQASSLRLSRGADAAISGLAGLGHLTLGISLIWLLLEIKRGVEKSAKLAA